MHLQYAFTAFNTERGDAGRWNASGIGINIVRTDQFPIMFPNISVVATVRLIPEELGTTHEVGMMLRGPQGIESEMLRHTFTPSRNAEGTAPAFYEHIQFLIEELVVAEIGTYEIALFLDGAKAHSLFFDMAGVT